VAGLDAAKIAKLSTSVAKPSVTDRVKDIFMLIFF
jgi:hypothetical protein